MSEETIWLRGGPLEDKFISWRGGNEVERDFVVDLSPALPGKPGAALGPATALHRRSEDDPRRFDFVGFVDYRRPDADAFQKAVSLLSGRRWAEEQAEKLIEVIRESVA